MTVHHSVLSDLDPLTLHALMALRSAVFVVEQNCVYPDLDDRDVEPLTEHVWTADEQGPTAYLRVLTEPDGAARVGRVCTRVDARGAGLAAALLTDVLDRHPGRVIGLEAQAHLEGWYGRFGFVTSGAGYVEDGIPHLPMRREPTRLATPAR
jgi:ElaA protein